jgi:membrane-associated phospholipid phosphatase
MPGSSDVERPGHYVSQLISLLRQSAVRLVEPSRAPARAAAARRTMKQALWLATVGAVVVIALMLMLDVAAISIMPKRGTPSLWPVRILTDFGKEAYVLWLLAGALLLIWLIVPLLRDRARLRLQRLGTSIQYILLAVLVPGIIGEVLKWIVGRGRPFVGGKADAFHLAPFNGTEAYLSLPSAHSVTAFALAFAIAAIWPKLRIPMAVYALAIAASRLVLLAHHPSDVLAGAVIGVIGAMAVRYWFAARQLGFVIRDDGEIVPR